MLDCPADSCLCSCCIDFAGGAFAPVPTVGAAPTGGAEESGGGTPAAAAAPAPVEVRSQVA